MVQKNIKTSLLSNPQFDTKSAFEKNLRARASSIKPRTILVDPSQFPDLGIIFNAFGNKANKPKGSPSAKPKPNIPNDNCIAPESEEIDPARSDPKIGPVQEKETIAKVNAMKKIPKVPLNFEDLLSEKLTQLFGNFNS